MLSNRGTDADGKEKSLHLECEPSASGFFDVSFELLPGDAKSCQKLRWSWLKKVLVMEIDHCQIWIKDWQFSSNICLTRVATQSTAGMNSAV